MPWCVRKCPYCDFNSHALKNELPETAYISALINDLKQDLIFVQNRKLNSIFIGGGTPSLFSPKSIELLLTQVQSLIPFAKEIEITLEANPGTVEQARFAGFKQAGINRVSLGIQSFADQQLKKLGRIHDGKEAILAIKALEKADITNFNLDLMYGLPDQTLEEGLNDLNLALSFNPPHFSWYQLTLEPNTLFHHQPPKLPHEDTIWRMQETGKNLLAQANYLNYEISAYSCASSYCRHNLNYWQFGDYLGIGAGAHGKITDEKNNKVVRYWKHKHPTNYLTSKNFYAENKIVDAPELLFEFMLNALRLKQPISFDLFTERTGLTATVLNPYFVIAKTKNLLVVTQDHFMPSELGYAFLNDLTAIFLSS